MKTVVVIGGGPAGMMAAGTSAFRNRVLLLEKNEKLGKKMYITGKGRCNFTNACSIDQFLENVVTNKSFMYSSIYAFSNEQTIQFFNDLGLKEKIERGNRVFPASDKSSDVIKAMSRYLKDNGVQVHLNTKVRDILTSGGEVMGVKLANDEVISCDAVVLATGGKTYPSTGSTGDGYVFANRLGHKVIPPKGGLIPLVSEDDFIKELQGLSLKNVTASLYKGDRLIKKLFGEMLFTHFGISGPIILSLSSLMDEEKGYSVKVNLKPALDEKTIHSRIQRDFQKYNNKSLKNALKDRLPNKLIPVIIRLTGIDTQKKANQITREEREKLRYTIQNLTVSISGKRPIDEGIVTSGGVDVKEINPATMESKIVKGLYFAGEIIDVDALTGGFNMQIAFSTGYLAGLSC